VVSQANTPDLFVCPRRYVDSAIGGLNLTSVFKPVGLLTSADYRRAHTVDAQISQTNPPFGGS